MRGERCTVNMADVCTPVAFDYANHTPCRLLFGRSGRLLRFNEARFASRYFAIGFVPLISGAFGVIVLESS